MKLSQILKSFHASIVAGSGDPQISSVVCDTRKVVQGSLFCAIRGYKTDGNKFIDEALEKGAVAVCVEQSSGFVSPSGACVIETENSRRAYAAFSAAFYGNPADSLTMIGVTGTNGKSSTVFMIEHILTKLGVSGGMMTTIFNRIAGRETVSNITTPDAGVLQQNLAEIRDSGGKFAVFEVSSHALFLDRVYGAAFDRVIFTNLTRDHLDFHENFENYYTAKRRLFESELLKKGHSIALINSDDEWGRRLLKEAQCPVLSYSVAGAKADFIAYNPTLREHVSEYTLKHDGREIDVELPIAGRFNIYNSLVAISAVISLGYEPSAVIEAMRSFPGVKGRMESVKAGQDFIVLVDYAHTPDGVQNILKSARELCTGKLFVVVGCGGDRDKTKRPIMAQMAARFADIPVLTSDNPRTERPEDILDDMCAGLEILKSANGCVAGSVKKPESDLELPYYRITDRRTAINLALANAHKGDVVVIAGKGHEDYQIIGTEKIHFDDVECVRDFFSCN